MKVMRLVIYEGPDEWVQQTIDKSIHGTKRLASNMTIKAITLGTLPGPVDILVKEAEAGAQSASYPDSKDKMSF